MVQVNRFGLFFLSDSWDPINQAKTGIFFSRKYWLLLENSLEATFSGGNGRCHLS